MKIINLTPRLALLLMSTSLSVASTGASNALASADTTCVQELRYPSVLKAPNLEYWATNSAIFGGSADIECNLTKQLVGLFGTLQTQIAAKSPDHRPLRGTHSKGTCLTGTFETQLEENLTDGQKASLQQAGLFAAQGQIPAQFRFANAASHIAPDWKADVRALSMKVKLPSGKEQDFAFNNVPRFQIDTLANFVALMEMQTAILTGEIPVDAKTGAPSVSALFGFFSKRYGPIDGTRYLLNLNNIKKRADADSRWYDSYTKQVYWSTTAFAVGQSVAPVKFGALPCDMSDAAKRTAPAAALQSKNLSGPVLASESAAQSLAQNLVKTGVVTDPANYLSELLTAQVKTAPVCYNLFVQFLSEESTISGDLKGARAKSLVENPSLTWQGPVHLVGQLRMNQVLDQQTCDDPSSGVNPISKADGIEGLGQINRARDFVENASRASR